MKVLLIIVLLFTLSEVAIAQTTCTCARTNVALGAAVTASSSANTAKWPAASAVDGDRAGTTWGLGTGGWNDGTRSIYPDSLEVGFSGAKLIDEINIFTLQNNWTTACQPDRTTPATGEGILDFEVQAWNGVAWVTVPGGSITGNDKAWRQFTFAPIITAKMRVVVNNARNNYSRIVEVEAFGCN